MNVAERELFTGNPTERYGIPERPAWHSEASCNTGTGALMDVFFPDRSTTSGTNRFRREMCRACPVRVECAEAGRDEPFGWWGGISVEARGMHNITGPDPLRDIR